MPLLVWPDQCKHLQHFCVHSHVKTPSPLPLKFLQSINAHKIVRIIYYNLFFTILSPILAIQREKFIMNSTMLCLIVVGVTLLCLVSGRWDLAYTFMNLQSRAQSPPPPQPKGGGGRPNHQCNTNRCAQHKMNGQACACAPAGTSPTGQPISVTNNSFVSVCVQLHCFRNELSYRYYF
jgi:hypothetical protein